jgi:hypothetical protein
MDQKICPFSLAGTTTRHCLQSECTLWMNNRCVFIEIHNKIDRIIPEIEKINQRIHIL